MTSFNSIHASACNTILSWNQVISQSFWAAVHFMRRKCSFLPTALFNLCGRSVHFGATYSLHYSCKSVNGLPHIRMSADNVDIIGFQILQHCFSPLSSEYIIFSEASGGSMISIPFLRITFFFFGRPLGTTVSELVVPLSWIKLIGTISWVCCTLCF